MKLLVTGGAGFIGSAVVRLATSRGHQVVNLDALTYAACLDNVASVADSPLYAFEQADIRDRAALDRVFTDHQPDVVMHLAAETPADKIAETLLTMATAMQKSQQGGIYHFAGKPDTSWAGFASEIFKQAGKDVTVTGIPSADYPTPAARPLNSRMDCTQLETDFGIPAADWAAGIAGALIDLKEMAL